ncbi:MAG: DUF1015 family protein [Proteobacteria bacterium]|nr:DUF1015 family protein [Pseudomonadota bacterium]
MLYPFQPIVFSAEAIERFGEPTRLSSDRSPGDGNPISVRVLHEAETPGSYRRGENRTRSFVDRDVMVLHDGAYAIYSIARPNRPDMAGIVGMLDLEHTTVYPHEDVMPSSVATRRADIERAGAFLEPVILTTHLQQPIPPVADDLYARQVRYDDEVHTLSVIAPDQSVIPPAVLRGDLVILDGHHRIAAAIQHADLTSTSPSILAMVVDAASPGLFVEPQHRVLSGPPIDLTALPETATVGVFERGDVVPPGAVAIVSDTVSVVINVPGDRSLEEARISALTLERQLLDLLLQRVEGYATRESDAFEQLDSGANAVAIMGDLRIADVMTTARRGVVLPEKTTCFNPKVAVGLVGAPTH